MSEYRFRNSQGIIPVPIFRVHGGLTWVYLNCPDQVIPLEALDLSAPPSRKSYGPTGLLLEGEWSQEISWNKIEKAWHAFIPLDSPHDRTWYLEHERGVATLASPSYDHYILPYQWLVRANTDIMGLHKLCESIRRSSPYGSNSPIPDIPDFESVGLRFEEERDAEISAMDVRRSALDHLGFLGWWTNSVSNWDKWLRSSIVDEITDWQVKGRRVRGVLVNLSKDWTNMNIGNLVRNDVPVCYPWTEREANDPRFVRYSPEFLRAFHDFAAQQTPFADMTSAAIPGLMDRFPDLKKYDEFGQNLYQNFHVANRDLNSGSFYFSIVDFEQWRRRHVPDSATELAYTKTFFFARIPESRTEQIVFWRNRPLRCIEWLPSVRAEFEGKGYAWDGYDYTGELNSDIREMFKVRYAPRSGSVYNDVGELDHLPRSLEQRLSSTIREAPERELDSMDVEDKPWGRYVDSTRRSSPGARPSLEVRLTNPNVPHAIIIRRSVSPRFEDETSRSSPSVASTVRGLEEPTVHEGLTERDLFVDDLKDWGLKFCYNGVISDVSAVPLNAVWNPFFLQHGVLYVEADAEVRLRLWANCIDGWDGIGDVLVRAINHGVAFRIGVKPQDLYVFRPKVVTLRDLATSVYYETGFVDRPLEYGRGGLELYGRYRAELLKVLDRPHARAVIAMGGPLAWIAKRYVGGELIQRYMDGPSIQVSVHQKGWLDQESFTYAQADRISAEEENTIYGYVKYGDNEVDKTLWPTAAALRKALGHFRGEWNPICEAAYTTIFNKLQNGQIELKTRSAWVHWLRSPDHGDKKAAFVPSPSDFEAALARIKEGFSEEWNRAALHEINVPEFWDPLIETEK